MFEGLGIAFLILIAAGVGTLVDELAGRGAFGGLCGICTFILVYVFLYAMIDSEVVLVAKEVYEKVSRCYSWGRSLVSSLFRSDR